MTDRQIGELFGKLSYSAAAKVRERFSEQLSTDGSLRRIVRKITATISQVKP
jgi:hypothetical protein